MKSGYCLLITIGFFAGLYHTAAQVNFAPATNYAVGSISQNINTSSVVAADVNEDGKVDLISANLQANTLTVLTNNGSGVFGSNATYSVFSLNPSPVVAVDANGDGMVDLISKNGGANTLTVLTNNGSGRFARASTPGAGGNPHSVVTADINGDGKIDLIVADMNTNAVTVLTNAGNGTFLAGPTPPPLPFNNFSWFVVTADVNGDGKPDLIDVDGGNGGTFSYLRILTNNGDETFTLSATNALVTTWPGSFTTADVNGNGKVDLIIPDYDSGSGNTLEVLTNNGAGIFSSNATYAVGTGPLSIIAADINGDGKMDLISASIFGKLTILTNNGMVALALTQRSMWLLKLSRSRRRMLTAMANWI